MWPTMTNCFLVKTTLHSSARKRFFLISAVVWTLLIAFLCLVSFNKLPSLGVSGADKYVHIALHFTFTLLWFLYADQTDASKSRLPYKVFASSFVYGIVIEIAQELFTATRHADVFDVMANTFGALLGIAVITAYRAQRKKKIN